jgi:mannose-6-phosphate isomerase-like protein (cupin superfamily)
MVAAAPCTAYSPLYVSLHFEENAVLKPFRRLVTGHDDAGRAIIQSDGAPARVKELSIKGSRFHEIWNTREMPVRIDRKSGEPHEDGIVLVPPKNGTRIRVVDFPPETDEIDKLDAETIRKYFAEVSATEASTHGGGSTKHAHMHRTETIDYGIVLEGEITLIVDEGESTVRAGDIVIQRGTNHAWANRSGKDCRIAFVLIDGQFVDGLS